MAGDGDRLVALVAHFRNRQGAEPLGQGLTVGPDQQGHVGEGRDGTAQRLEDLDLGPGVGDVILAADDVGDAHVDVVDHGRQGVEEQAILADQHRIRHRCGVDLGVAAGQVLPGDPLAVQPEAPVRTTALGLVGGPVGFAQAQGGAIIDRRQAARELHLAAAIQFVGGFIAGVQTAGRLEPRSGLLVAVEPLRLVVALIPDEAEPGQVVLDALFELGRGAGQVGVVDAQDEGAALPLGEHPVDQGGADIADVQFARRRRGEADLDGHEETLRREARRSRRRDRKSRRG